VGLFRRKAAGPVSTTRVCPACNIAGLVQLVPGQVCPTCKTQQAWDEAARGGPLRIDREAIDAAVRRREGEAAGERAWRKLIAWVPPIVSFGLAVFAGCLLYAMLRPRSIGPLAALLDDLVSSQRHALWTGIGTGIVGIVGVVRIRRNRHHRRLSYVASHSIAVVVGVSAAITAGILTLATNERWGGTHTMPERDRPSLAPHVERILAATVVVMAPDGDGDASNPAIGTGAVVGRQADRAWIVTCSHVAMPYAAVGSWRRPEAAHAVWVQLADGREGQARVRWAAPPPLDVALVELQISNPPEPVSIAPDASMLQPDSDVMFVPNPYRMGWLVHQGRLVRRDPHTTPAGKFELLVTDLPVIPGDSGSGLYDARGQLVGLNTWTKLENGYAHGISLPSETMRELVAVIERGDLNTGPKE
jgi:S1-C subfamily serine protease